jgi:hypothetical protein
MLVDLRERAADPATSIAVEPRPPGANGSAALLVEDEDRHGDDVLVVVLDQHGTVLTQRPTTVGGA